MQSEDNQCNYTNTKKWTKYVTYVLSVLIIISGFFKFFSVITAITKPHDYVVNVYVVFLGVVLFCAECEIEFVVKHFNFLRHYFGKSFYAIL